MAVLSQNRGLFRDSLVDLTRQLPVLLLSLVVSSVGYIALAFFDPGENLGLAFFCILTAGLFTPPLEGCLRTIWKSVLGDDRLVHSAFALDSGLQELIFIVGPLIVATCAALVDPSFALLFTTILSLFGAIGYCAIKPVRRWKGKSRPDADGISRWVGPLRRASVNYVLISIFFIGVAIGILNLTALAFADQSGSPWESGAILGIMAFGALVGGVVYGLRAPLSAAIDHLPLLAGALFFMYVPMVIISLMQLPSLALISFAAFAAGVPLAPTIAAAFSALSTQTILGTETEAFSWLVSMMLFGNAVGAAIAGKLISGSHWSSGGVVIAAPLLFAVFMTYLAKHVQVPKYLEAS